MIEQIVYVLEANRDEQQAVKMKAYLRNQFEFLGVPKSNRKDLEKDFIKQSKELEYSELLRLVEELYVMEYREYMYLAQQMLEANIKRLKYEDLVRLALLTLHNPWWENTDGYNAVVKKWLKLNPEMIKPFILEYYKSDSFWLRRLAIICQLGLKEQTDQTMLKRAIRYNQKYDEFFIQKAIGWALRDYSKCNPEMVKQYLTSNEDKLSNLAIREASKYL